jgi:hypothetical protein
MNLKSVFSRINVTREYPYIDFSNAVQTKYFYMNNLFPFPMKIKSCHKDIQTVSTLDSSIMSLSLIKGCLHIGTKGVYLLSWWDKDK